MGTYWGETPASEKQMRYLDLLVRQAGYRRGIDALAACHVVSVSKAERKYLGMARVSEAIKWLLARQDAK